MCLKRTAARHLVSCVHGSASWAQDTRARHFRMDDSSTQPQKNDDRTAIMDRSGPVDRTSERSLERRWRGQRTVIAMVLSSLASGCPTAPPALDPVEPTSAPTQTIEPGPVASTGAAPSQSAPPQSETKVSISTQPLSGTISGDGERAWIAKSAFLYPSRDQPGRATLRIYVDERTCKTKGRNSYTHPVEFSVAWPPPPEEAQVTGMAGREGGGDFTTRVEASMVWVIAPNQREKGHALLRIRTKQEEILDLNAEGGVDIVLCVE